MFHHTTPSVQLQRRITSRLPGTNPRARLDCSRKQNLSARTTGFLFLTRAEPLSKRGMADLVDQVRRPSGLFLIFPCLFGLFPGVTLLDVWYVCTRAMSLSSPDQWKRPSRGLRRNIRWV